MNNGFFRSRSTTALICAIIALVWMLICKSAIGGVVSEVPTGDSAEAVGAQLGTMIGMAMLAPFFIIGWLATIFNWVAWFTNKSGLALTAAILYCVGLVLAPSYGFGFVPCIILGFIGYSRIKKIKQMYY